jgi:hypothetical protein
MELLLGQEKIITKSRISLNAGTLNQGFTVFTFRFWLTVGKRSPMRLWAMPLHATASVLLFLF